MWNANRAESDVVPHFGDLNHQTIYKYETIKRLQHDWPLSHVYNNTTTS